MVVSAISHHIKIASCVSFSPHSTYVSVCAFTHSHIFVPFSKLHMYTYFQVKILIKSIHVLDRRALQTLIQHRKSIHYNQQKAIGKAPGIFFFFTSHTFSLFEHRIVLLFIPSARILETMKPMDTKAYFMSITFDSTPGCLVNYIWVSPQS